MAGLALVVSQDRGNSWLEHVCTPPFTMAGRPAPSGPRDPQPSHGSVTDNAAAGKPVLGRFCPPVSQPSLPQRADGPATGSRASFSGLTGVQEGMGFSV